MWNIFKRKKAPESIEDYTEGPLPFMDSLSYTEEKLEKCKNCEFNGLCAVPGVFEYDLYTASDKPFDDAKRSILLVDDNEVITDFLMEDIKTLHEKHIFNINDFNILKISGRYAAFNVHCLLQQYNGLNVDYAIIDTSYTGAIINDNISYRLTGVDVYEYLAKYNKNIKFLFHSNLPNFNLKRTQKMYNKFKSISNEDCNEFILPKTIFNIRKRRAIIASKLFGKDLERKKAR